MAHLTIQPSIDDLRSRSLLGLIERLGALDLTPLLVYRLDSVPDSALLLLAWQFDMLAPQWQLGVQSTESVDALTNIDSLTDIDTLTSLADTAGQSDYGSWRILLKVAIPLHRTRGTPYAIKTALASLGWNNVRIEEGQATWGGTSYPPSQGWAVFRVLIPVAEGQRVATLDISRAVAAINFFKPVRSLLDSVWFVAPDQADKVPTPTDFVRTIFSQGDQAPIPTDYLVAPAWPIADHKTVSPLYNGHYEHGGLTYGLNEPAVVDSGVIVNGTPISAQE